jgi:hypothetical protein
VLTSPSRIVGGRLSRVFALLNDQDVGLQHVDLLKLAPERSVAIPSDNLHACKPLLVSKEIHK